MNKTPIYANFLRRIRYYKLGAKREELILRVLPAIALNLDEQACSELSDLFPVAVDLINLEIGFGRGEHLIAEAERLPTTGFIGCETYASGLARLLSEIEVRRVGNIKIYAGDGLDVLRWLPDRCLSRIDLLFPDPWPKLKHQNRRLLREVNVPLFARVLRAQGELRFASDNAHYAARVFECLSRSPFFETTLLKLTDCVKPWEHFSGTIYATKAQMEGRQSYFLRFRRNSTPVVGI